MRYDIDVKPVCGECETLAEHITQCAKCQVSFCYHFASDVDGKFCGNCLADFSAVKDQISKITERTNPQTGVVTSRRTQTCTQITYHGSDHLFTVKKIHDVSDADLENMAEYHYHIYSLCMSEREDRRVEKYQKLQAQQVKLSMPSVAGAPNARSRVKSEKVKSKMPSRAQLIAALTQVMGRTPTEQEIETIMKGQPIV